MNLLIWNKIDTACKFANIINVTDIRCLIAQKKLNLIYGRRYSAKSKRMVDRKL